MLDIKQLTIQHTHSDRTLISNLSFTIQPKEKVVIIGEEGNGKSTLLKWLADPSMINDYCTYQGTRIIKGRIGYLPQFVAEQDQQLLLNQYFQSYNVYNQLDVLTQLSLPIDLLQSNQQISSLSGGEKIKVQLARLLFDQVDVLLLDEPTNDLDIDTLRWLETFINQSSYTILYISHDQTLIKQTATKIIHLEQLHRKQQPKATIVQCSYDEYLSRRDGLYQRFTSIATKQRAEAAKQMEKYRQIYQRVEHEQRTITRQDPSKGRLLKKKMKSVKAMGRRFEKQEEEFIDFPEIENAIITRFDPTVIIPNGKTVLNIQLDTLFIHDRVLAPRLKLQVMGPRKIGIIGQNGVGKSTLLNLLYEQMRYRTDIIIGYMPQNYAAVLPYEKSAVEFLVPSQRKEEVTNARTYLGNLNFTPHEMMSKIKQLSGGQQAKLLYLNMVLTRANVLILDEPTRNFSPLSVSVVNEALRDFGGAIISISHDRSYLKQVCDEVYQLDNNGLYLVCNL